MTCDDDDWLDEQQHPGRRQSTAEMYNLVTSAVYNSQNRNRMHLVGLPLPSEKKKETPDLKEQVNVFIRLRGYSVAGSL